MSIKTIMIITIITIITMIMITIIIMIVAMIIMIVRPGGRVVNREDIVTCTLRSTIRTPRPSFGWPDG